MLARKSIPFQVCVLFLTFNRKEGSSVILKRKHYIVVSDSLPGVNLVAKVIPKGTGKGKKQKDQDRLCDTLHYEYLLYTGSLMQFPYLPQRPDNFYGTDDSVGVRYLVMERLETDLHSLSTRPQKLTPLEVATWGIQILSGLQFMHNIGFIFVDVKPENFMIKGKDLYFIDCKEFFLMTWD